MANGDQQSQAEALIPFTGYYTLDAVSGSFVMVDTTSAWLGAEEIEYAATISISPDGQNSESYALGQECSFADGRLLIADAVGVAIADLTFSNEGGPCSVKGTIEGKEVAGSTPFGPVQLSIWTGTYYQQDPKHPDEPYAYTPMLQIESDGTILFAAAGGSLEPVSSYWYNYGMFVVSLKPALPYMFEMGTAPGWGRVAGNATDGSMLVSIRLQQPGPHL